MSRGKYSPSLTRDMIARDNESYIYNADKQIPPLYKSGEDAYSERLHFGDYDSEGFDRYGYSAFDSEGNFIGLGSGIDRLGYTEIDYLGMSDEDFQDIG